MRKFYSLIAFAALILSLNSCVSLTGFEEGRSLGEGNSEFGVSLNYTSVPDLLDDDDDDIDTDIDNIGFPNIEMNYKYGITEKLDIGGKISTNLSATAYGKYQIVGDRTSQFALAPGFEVGTFAGVGYTVSVPVYASIHPTESVSININPRFMYQFASTDSADGISYYGGNFGLLFGKRHKFGLDFGYYALGGVDGDATSMLTFGLGGKFRFGDNMGSSSSQPTQKRRRR